MIILEREGPVGDSSGERQGLKGDHEGVNSPTGVSRWGHHLQHQRNSRHFRGGGSGDRVMRLVHLLRITREAQRTTLAGPGTVLGKPLQAMARRAAAALVGAA